MAAWLPEWLPEWLPRCLNLPTTIVTSNEDNRDHGQNHEQKEQLTLLLIDSEQIHPIARASPPPNPQRQLLPSAHLILSAWRTLVRCGACLASPGGPAEEGRSEVRLAEQAGGEGLRGLAGAEGEARATARLFRRSPLVLRLARKNR
jgi:hypothetical protein